jgi:hypothetical protein
MQMYHVLPPTLAASKNEKTRQEAEERFLQLFYGELAGVEDRSVELATIAFDDCWEKKGANCRRGQFDQRGELILPEKLPKSPALLENLALEIGSCTRTALEQAGHFETKVPAITGCPYD